MTVTRDVILDLLPVYLSGEASAARKATASSGDGSVSKMTLRGGGKNETSEDAMGAALKGISLRWIRLRCRGRTRPFR